MHTCDPSPRHNVYCAHLVHTSQCAVAFINITTSTKFLQMFPCLFAGLNKREMQQGSRGGLCKTFHAQTLAHSTHNSPDISDTPPDTCDGVVSNRRAGLFGLGGGLHSPVLLNIIFYSHRSHYFPVVTCFKDSSILSSEVSPLLSASLSLLLLVWLPVIQCSSMQSEEIGDLQDIWVAALENMKQTAVDLFPFYLRRAFP